VATIDRLLADTRFRQRFSRASRQAVTMFVHFRIVLEDEKRLVYSYDTVLCTVQGTAKLARS
jgi:hypothetical protein